MAIQLRAICKRVRQNNGIVEVLFSVLSDGESQESHILVNVNKATGPFEEGRFYSINIKLDD